MDKTRFMLWLKKKETRRTRLVIAAASIPIIITAALIALSGLLPRFILTIGGRLSLRVPAGFTIGEMYDLSDRSGEPSGYRSVSVDEEAHGFTYDRNGFEYPEAASLGGGYYIDNELVHSMDFKLKNPPAHGLIQIVNLTGSLDDLLRKINKNNSMAWDAFKMSKSDVDGLNRVTWEYIFKSGGKSVHGLESFYEYDGCLFRVSLFIPEKNFDDQSLKTYDNLIESVSIK